jgi:hypothetical protein
MNWTVTSWTLARTELLWIFPESRYIASAPTAQNTSHMAATVAWQLTAAEMCLPLCFVATSEAKRATLSTVACVTQQQAINTNASIVVCMFRGFCISTVPSWGKRHNIFLNSALAGGVCSASCLGYFTPREKMPDTHRTGGLLGPRTGVDDRVKRKILPLLRLELWSLSRPALSQSLYRLSYPSSAESGRQLNCCATPEAYDFLETNDSPWRILIIIGFKTHIWKLSNIQHYTLGITTWVNNYRWGLSWYL